MNNWMIPLRIAIVGELCECGIEYPDSIRFVSIYIMYSIILAKRDLTVKNWEL